MKTEDIDLIAGLESNLGDMAGCVRDLLDEAAARIRDLLTTQEFLRKEIISMQKDAAKNAA